MGRSLALPRRGDRLLRRLANRLMLRVEVLQMAKSTIVRTWFGGLIALAAGLLLAGLSIGLMLEYGGTFTPTASGDGYDFVPSLNGFFWLTVGGIVVAGALAAIGGIAQLVAWVGALLNTYQLPDKAWFAVLLVGGLLGFVMGIVGLVTMAVWVLAGPDGVADERLVSQRARVTLAPTS